jgi:hypothetical protein
VSEINDFFGFLKVQVHVPIGTYIPFLGIRDKNGLIYPTGTFNITVFSEELKCAMKYNTKVLKIYKALKFEKEIIFADFVDNLYNMRIKAKSKGQHAKQ